MFLTLCTFLLLISCSSAQSSKITVPSDLSSQFDPVSIALQVSYNGNAEEGLLDGAQVTQQVSSKAPVFALGDSSGVNTAITFVIAMVDTTTSNRVLHFLQPGFKADGTQTGISSSSEATVAYQAPGTLGDTGPRQYSWLLYQQVGSFPAKSIPGSGQTFNVESFQTANNLKPALAGIAMAVDVAGAASAVSMVSTPAASAPSPTVSASSFLPTLSSTSPPPPPATNPAVVTTSLAASPPPITSEVPSLSTSGLGAATFISVQPSSTIAALVSSLVSSIVSAENSETAAFASISTSLTQLLGSETSAIGSVLGSASSVLGSASTTLASQKSSAVTSSSIAQSTGKAAALAQDAMTLSIIPFMIAFMGLAHLA